MATVLITGTNRGLGLEFVKRFLKRGDQVIASCRDSSHAPELQGARRNQYVSQFDESGRYG